MKLSWKAIVCQVSSSTDDLDPTNSMPEGGNAHNSGGAASAKLASMPPATLTVSPQVADLSRVRTEANEYCNRDVLSTVIEDAFAKMAPSVRRDWITNTRAFLAENNNTVHYGIGFSGCDITSKVLGLLAQTWRSMGLECEFKHLWA